MFSSRKAAPSAFDNAYQATSFEEEDNVPAMQRVENAQPAVARSIHDQDILSQTEMARQYAGEVVGTKGVNSSVPEESEARLVIGRAIKMKGSVEDCGLLQVDGHFEASAQSKYLKVSESGVFAGDADVHSAEIIGRFDGNITVKDKLVIRSTGFVTGTVRYGSIEIASGGKISGDIQAILKNEPPVEQANEVFSQETANPQVANPEAAPAQPQPVLERKTLRLNVADDQPAASDTVALSDTV